MLPIGFLGTSPSFIPLSCLIVIHFFEWLFLGRSANFNKILLYATAYAITISLIYIMIYGTESHGANLIGKTFNLSVLTFLFLYPVFFINYKKIPDLGRYVKIAFWVAVFGVFLNDVIQLDIIRQAGFIHANESSNWRPRGFSGESSYLSCMIATLGLLSAYFTKEKFMRILIIAIALITTIYSSSKGGMVTILLVFGYFAFAKIKIRWWARILLLLLIAAGSNYIIDSLQSKFISDIEKSVSTATRTGLIFTSLTIVMHNPFGVGFSGFLPAISEYTSTAIGYLDKLFDLPFNYTEIMAYIGAETDYAVGTKTFLFDYLSYFGIPFLLAYIWFQAKLIFGLTRENDILLLGSLLFATIAISTYISPLGMYNIAIVYGVAFNEVFRKKGPDSSF